jgi:leucyl-tRNA synthetase
MMDKILNKWTEYNPQAIESKWQKEWEKLGIYRAHESSPLPKYYCLDFFPYPSGEGLHVGHCRNYIPTDVISRFMRMRGYNVLHPMGWDAFGEPTEQHAISSGIHPRLTTDRNAANYRRQMTMIGTSYDWSREIDSSHPDFYRWTQRIFLLLYERGLAYRDVSWQWWCPTCQTTLSSHEVNAGVCWRGHKGVTKKDIPAWYFRITAYAEELLAGLNEIDWPEAIKTMQRNWIGRSEGCEILFHTEDGQSVPIFTTRPDTIFGATFFVLAPEHLLVEKLTTELQRAQVEAYVEQALSQAEIDRLSLSTEKSGVFTGGYVLNPLSNERIPVWIADYVLLTYGTGAVMGVPAHDQRDFEFARKYGLPIRVVIAPPGYRNEPLEMAYTEAGSMINSGKFDGLSSEQGMKQVCDALSEGGIGGPKVQYKMRDWLISRQRYWGTPIPIIYCEDCGELPVPVEDLPVLLPETDDFTPDGSGRSPLARIPDFVSTSCPICGGKANREVDTMGGFACSSWYFLRFASPQYDQGPFEPEALNYWMPVDLYVGGAEHAVLHLLYARFWTLALADADLVPFKEPFKKLMNQGQLLGPDGQRMSKSRGNVIIPDEIVGAYGADSLRIYEMFMAPFDQDIAWNTDGINGAWRFLNKLWNLFLNSYYSSQSVTEVDPELEQETHRLIRRVTHRIEGFRFNTMISDFMEYVNLLYERYRLDKWHTESYHDALNILMILLAPVVPHIAEELWHLTDHEGSVHESAWPEWDESKVQDQDIEIAVQVDGKLRAVLGVSSDTDQEIIEQLALDERSIQQHLEGREIIKVIYVPGRILNLVTKGG